MESYKSHVIVNTLPLYDIYNHMRLFCLLWPLLMAYSSTAQFVLLSKAPKDAQLFQRSLETNQGKATLSGKVPATSGYELLELRLYQEGILLDALPRPLDFSTADTLDFTLEVPIPAICKNHRLELWGRQKNTGGYIQERVFHDLVAGDFFIINGQSNAIASASPFPEDLDPFTRSWYQPFGWGPLNLSFPGQWGGRLARQLRDSLDIPIAIFNGATGGVNILSYLRNDQNPDEGNYGALRQRLEAAGYDRKIRAVLWYQGEADAWGQPISYYNGNLKALQKAWIEDYQIEHLFLFQMRYRSCSSPLPIVLEAQRQFALEDTLASVMSTTNAAHDSCHYEYYEGYQSLGARMANLVLHTLYGKNITDALAPNPKKAWLYHKKRIAIAVENTDTLFQIGMPWVDFRLEGSTTTITGGQVSADTIFLDLSDSLAFLPRVSYLSHPGKAPDWIVNRRGVGLLAFYDFPVDSMPVDTTPVDTMTHVGIKIPGPILEKAPLKVFPSPAHDLITVQWPAAFPAEELLVFDQQGKQILRQGITRSASFQMAIHHWPPGLYALRLNGKGSYLLGRVAVE